MPHKKKACLLKHMRIPALDRSLRLPLALAAVLALGALADRLYLNRDTGFRLYSKECSICHHGGNGQAAETPPIFGRVNSIARTLEGKRYIVNVLLNGLNGPIKADGKPFDWSMPSFRRLNDDDIAAILTWVTHQRHTGPAVVFTAADIAAQREHPLSSEEVHTAREELGKSQPLP